LIDHPVSVRSLVSDDELDEIATPNVESFNPVHGVIIGSSTMNVSAPRSSVPPLYKAHVPMPAFSTPEEAMAKPVQPENRVIRHPYDVTVRDGVHKTGTHWPNKVYKCQIRGRVTNDVRFRALWPQAVPFKYKRSERHRHLRKL